MLDVTKILRVLLDLRMGECWCQVGIGNPTFRVHTEACKKAAELREELTLLVVSEAARKVCGADKPVAGNESTKTGVAHLKAILQEGLTVVHQPAAGFPALCQCYLFLRLSRDEQVLASFECPAHGKVTFDGRLSPKDDNPEQVAK